MGRPVALADVGLELDDPPDPPLAVVVPIADQPPAEQSARQLEGRQVEDRAIAAAARQRPRRGRLSRPRR
jgi:hypothetical protein